MPFLMIPSAADQHGDLVDRWVLCLLCVRDMGQLHALLS